jgi:hypothetical protein
MTMWTAGAKADVDQVALSIKTTPASQGVVYYLSLSDARKLQVELAKAVDEAAASSVKNLIKGEFMTTLAKYDEASKTLSTAEQDKIRGLRDAVKAL